MARLIDVAKAAGVSRSTVSNVFNNPDLVRPKVRERVEAAARTLEYLGPDPKGRLLREGKFNAIAVMPPSEWGIADSLRNPVFDSFLLGVSEVCDEAGANLVIVPDRPGSTGVKDALVDGFIFGRVEHMQQIEAARLRRLPYTVVDFDPGSGINAVWVDTRAGSRAAAQHLLDLGHRRFAILSFLRQRLPPRFFPGGEARDLSAAGHVPDQGKYLGYADAFAAAGIDIASFPMVQADPWDEGAAGMLLDAAPEATAILSMSVMQGISVIEEATRRGIAVPRDLSVVGYNDIAEATRSSPPLTTVDGMQEQKGRAAARMVFGGAPPRHDIITPELIVRGSTAKVRKR